MRVTHVVTYVSRDGAFGGPVAVATAQCAGLGAQGHQVTLVAGTDGSSVRAEAFSFVGARAKRMGRSFATVVAPGVWFAVARRVRREVFHVHFGRDLVSLGTGAILALSGARYVVQPHGMVQPDRRAVVRAIDGLVTRRVLRRAQRWLTLDEHEENGLRLIQAPRDGQIRRVFNAVPVEATVASRARPKPLVVFIARLHPRKGAAQFAEAAERLLSDGVAVDFEIWGPDEGELARVRAVIQRVGSEALRYRGALAPGEASSVLDRADVFVLPSRGEVFPMTVLEALSAGAVVVGPSDCMMLQVLADAGAALLTNQDPVEIARQVRAYVDSPELVEATRSAGRRVLEQEWSVEALVSRLEQAYA